MLEDHKTALLHNNYRVIIWNVLSNTNFKKLSNYECTEYQMPRSNVKKITNKPENGIKIIETLVILKNYYSLIYLKKQ